MRNNEQFRAYVYEKADAKRAKNKRMHAAWTRGAVAFSLLVVVGGVYLLSSGDFTSDGITNEKMASSAEYVAGKSIDMSATNAVASDYASLVDVEDGDISVAYDEQASVQESLYTVLTEVETKGYIMQYAYAASSLSEDAVYTIARNAAEYTGDLTNIDFSENVALIIRVGAVIESWKITYGEESIIVQICTADTEKNDSVYMILLEKEKYIGQKIEIEYQ